MTASTLPALPTPSSPPGAATAVTSAHAPPFTAPNFAERSWWRDAALPVAIFLGLAGLLYSQAWSTLGPSMLVDLFDSAMQTTRASDWAAHGHIINRDGAPDGYALHWTLPFTWLLMALGALAAPFAAWPEAIKLTAPLAGPLCTAATIAGCVWAAKAWPVPGAGRTAGLCAAFTPIFMSYGGLGTADHHLAQAAACAVTLGGVARLFVAPHDRKAGSIAALGAALALWVGVETLPIVASLLGLLVLERCWRVGERSAGLSRLALALPILLATALAIDPPAGGLLQAVPDRLSIAQLALIAGGCAVLAFCCALPARWPLLVRLAAGGGSGAVAGALWLGVFPDSLPHMNAELPPLAKEVLYNAVGELYSALATFNLAAITLWPLLAGCAAACWLAAVTADHQRRWWAGVAFVLLLGIAGAVLHVRLSVLPSVLAAVAWGTAAARIAATFASASSPWRRLAPSAWILVPAVTLTAPALGPTTLTAEAGWACKVEALPEEWWPRDNAVIMTTPSLTPLVLYTAPVRTVSGIYHRNGKGAEAALRFFAFAPEQALAILQDRGAEAVLACDNELEAMSAVLDTPEGQHWSQNGLGAALLNDSALPSWLVEEPLPAEVGGLRLFNVRDAQAPGL